MPKNNDIKFVDCFNLPSPGLRAYFGNVRHGQPDEYRTPFADGCTCEEVLSAWSSTLETLSSRWPSLVEYENDLRSKVGPASVMLPLHERIKDIDHYYDDILLPSRPICKSAIVAVCNEYSSIGPISLRSQEHTLENMNMSKNSGAPYFISKKWKAADKTLPCAVDHTFQHLNYKALDDSWPTYSANKRRPPHTWKSCAVLGWRGQMGGPDKADVKQRVIWMFPFAVTVCELQAYQPMIEGAQTFNINPAWVSLEEVDRRITKMFDTKGANDLVVCTDFTRFDQHFNAELQDAASQILRSLLDDSELSRYWLDEVFPIKFEIPLAYDYERIRVGKHGMGSGSGGTNFDESLVHRALQYEAALDHHQKLNPNSQCLGDDGVLTYPGITVEDVISTYTAHGQEMNESKQYASKDDCVYLRYWHHRDYRINGICRGVYSTYRALGKLMEQERFYDPETWSKEMTALRQLSIIENVKWHPLREQFAEFCMKRDKYRLGLDIPGFLDNLGEWSEKAKGIRRDFLGYVKSGLRDQEGINSWWIVNYLRSHG